MSISRRNFVKQSGLALGSVGLSGVMPVKIFNTYNESPLSIHIFSKHLQFLDYFALGEKAAEMGFAGVDLTVRKGGHVHPENVKSELPEALDSIRRAGSECIMMTTRIGDVRITEDRNVLRAASQGNIKYYRCDWYKYLEGQSMIDSLNQYQKKIKDLSNLNMYQGLVGCYQNHAGTSIGASIWEIHRILTEANKEHFGVQYDIRHAVVEGGLSWENGLRLIQKHIKTIVLKDFKWGKVGNQWKPVNTPIGEGMVDFKKYFRFLKNYQINVPVSLHLEYPLGGAEHGTNDLSVDPGVIYKAMIKDLQAVNKLWKEA